MNEADRRKFRDHPVRSLLMNAASNRGMGATKTDVAYTAGEVGLPVDDLLKAAVEVAQMAAKNERGARMRAQQHADKLAEKFFTKLQVSDLLIEPPKDEEPLEASEAEAIAKKITAW